MKTMNAILCGLGLLIAPALHAQDDWTLKSPATKPSARFAHAMASLGGDQVLLFGGLSASIFSDETWVYDLSDNTWTLQSPATKPSARIFPAMASLGGDQVLLFGGQDAGGFDDETWVYDLSDNMWTLKSPATKPSARYIHAMAFIGGDQVLLFGGFDTPSYSDESWVYDLSDNTWTLQSPVAKPSARNAHAMAFLGGDQVLLFGGQHAGGRDDETWVYDLSDNTWTLQSPATKPTARTFHAMASLSGDQVLLFAGQVVFIQEDTWVYDLSDNIWTLKTPFTSPGPRGDPAMASLGDNQVLLFSGTDSNDETWVYTGATTPPNLALNQPTTASSSKTAHPPDDAVDGSTTTHWRSGTVGGSTKVWWRVDLSAVYNIDNVVIDWSGSFYAKQYKIQVSNTAVPGSWETVYTDIAGNGGIDNVTFPATAARHVRIFMTQHNETTERINEVKVYAASGMLAKVSEIEDSEIAKSETVTSYELAQNYPNPFNPATTIKFALPEAGAVSLSIYNLNGQLVRKLASGEYESGRYEVVWDGKSDAGISVATGLYVYVFKAGDPSTGSGQGFVAKRKLVLMK